MVVVLQSTSSSLSYHGANFTIVDYILFVSSLLVFILLGVYHAWQVRKSTATTNQVFLGNK